MTTTTETLFCAAYQIDNSWMVFVCPTCEDALARIAFWRENCKFEHPMKIITKTTITTEQKV